MISMSFIFLNPLSEVTSGSCKKREVAAMIASGVFTIFCCLIFMAMFFISGVSSMIIQSCKRVVSFFFSANKSLGQPKSSISEMTEQTTVPSRKGSVFANPSCTLIRKLVSATKLNPFISDSLLIGNSIQASLKFSEMFAQGFLFTFFGNPNKCLSHLFLSNRLCNFDNHNSKIIKTYPQLIFENVIWSNNHCSFKPLFCFN